MDDVSATSGSVRVAAAPGSSFVEWSAVLAGGAMAAALSFVLLTFGSAIGLSFVSPWKDVGVSTKLIGSFAVFWAMAQQIGAAMAGAYIAGRMRMRWAEANSRRGGISRRPARRAGLGGRRRHHSSLPAVGGRFCRQDWNRSRGPGRIGRERGSVGIPDRYPAACRTAAVGPGDCRCRCASHCTAIQHAMAITTPNSDLRAELLRTFARAVANGTLVESDRTYLAGVVAQRTGLPQQDAERRVTEAYAEATRVAKEAAEKARRSAILVGLVTAASLVISLGAAWWAAIQGGNHRDNSIPARFNLPPMHRRRVA